MSEQVIDWAKVAYLTLVSREIDELEEKRLVPEKKVLYQFSARGHDVAQIIIGQSLNRRGDAASAYYRSRPFLLSLGLALDDAFAGPLMRSGGFSDGRDIGVVCNLPNHDGPAVLPMSGDVGSQYTPSAGWAQSLIYKSRVLKDSSCKGAIAMVLGGEASVATNGFWSALTMATTLKLPLLFYIEDNQYGISVPSKFQTPGANIAENLKSFKNLLVLDGNGTDPEETLKLSGQAFSHVRSWAGPALLRLTVPRLTGHSGQDTQSYKSEDLLESERERDPLLSLKKFMLDGIVTSKEWDAIESKAKSDTAAALENALARPAPDVSRVHRYVFSEQLDSGAPELQKMGGLLSCGYTQPEPFYNPTPEPTRINMVTAIRRTLQHELKINPRVLVFGEDVGPKGGVHAATMGLQAEFGDERVFDTSLSEEGIIGRAVGMAIAGLMPVAEIQFRKYADPATEQLNNCGSMRWRTANRFAAPIVVRIPGGYFKCGDPWHSVSNEVLWAHAIGWQVAVPSNAEDAVGLLRAAMRSNNPTIFFEHRAMLDGSWARRAYPGDNYIVPFGRAQILRSGAKCTVISWAGMVERCVEALEASGVDGEIIDLRTIAPWDKACVLESVRKTRRVLIVHEDGLTAGFGAEVSATIASECFFNLDAPIQRLAVQDLPIPHNVQLMESVVPSVASIQQKITDLMEF